MPGKFKQIPYNLDIGSKQTVRRNTADDSFEVVEIYSKGETDTQLSNKVDKETGKGLSTNDYTTTEKNKLAGIEANAEVNITENVNAGTNITIDRVGKDITINSTGGGGATTLDDLTDVTITTPVNGQALTYNGTQWVNSTPAGAGDMLKSENLSGLANYATARQNLGLDTTANQTDSIDKRFMSDSQESKLDGIDMSTKLDKELINLSGIDLNTITDNGFYCANATCTNLPEAGVKTRLRVNKDPSNANLSMQEALTTTTLVSYVRTTANGGTSWTGWVRVKATDETKVGLTGNETIAGDKTFSGITRFDGTFGVNRNPSAGVVVDMLHNGSTSILLSLVGNLVTSGRIISSYSNSAHTGDINNFTTDNAGATGATLRVNGNHVGAGLRIVKTGTGPSYDIQSPLGNTLDTYGGIFRFGGSDNSITIGQSTVNYQPYIQGYRKVGVSASQVSTLRLQTFGGGLTIGSNFSFNSSGNLLIGTSTDIASSRLTINSTTQGFLPPRMTTEQRDAIASPATGLVVYNTTTNTLNHYNGSSWVGVGSGDSVGTTQTTLVAGENITAGNAICTSIGGAIRTDASNINKLNFIGFATNTVSSGGNVIIDTSGLSATQSGLTPLKYYYLSNTPGAISTTPGTNIVSVGMATSFSRIKINNQDDFYFKYLKDIVAGNTFTAIGVPGNTTNYTGTSYSKLRQFTCGISGTYTIEFGLNVSGTGDGNIGYGRIYKNGVSFGTERTRGVSGTQVFTENLSFLAGDTIEFWVRNSIAGYGTVLSATAVKYDIQERIHTHISSNFIQTI